MLARGMYALHARYGHLPFEVLTIYGEQAARFGFPISRAFATDLAVVAQPLAGDPVARATFFQANGQPLAEGMGLVQPDLAATLTQLRVSGVGDLYIGGLARKLVGAAGQAGGGLTLAALRDGLPRYAAPISIDAPNGDRIAFPPPPADGGLAAAAAFKSLLAAPNDLAGAGARALAVAAAWRAQGSGQGGNEGNPSALLAGPVPQASLPPLPASAGLVTLDRNGQAVTCTFTMNNLFGTGRIAPGTGILLAASPGWMPPPLLASGIAWNPHLQAFRAAVAGTGQEGAPLAVADEIMQTLHAPKPVTFGGPPLTNNAAFNPGPIVTVGGAVTLQPPPDPGRADVMSCGAYLPGVASSCSWVTDPRAAGLAVGSN
jgi:gamma-glutamyltranspeptidase/glutathione hydrolase